MSNGGNQPNLQIVGQYIKDLSFENPSAPQGFSGAPELDFGIDVQTRAVGPDHHEVVLMMRVRATGEGKALFLMEMAYAAMVRATNLPEEMLQPALMVQVPILMFPFARRIVADVVRDGGMPPLVIEPIDFNRLYQARMAQGAQAPQPDQA
jgi:preprotein translocase subunit SecB